MATDKQTKLRLIQDHPDFLLEVMTFGAESLLHQMLRQNLLKNDKAGKKPNRAACHPFALQQLRRNILLSIEVPNG